MVKAIVHGELFDPLLGPFHGAIAVPSVTRCRCRCRRRRRGHRCAGDVRRDSSDTWWMVMRRAAARCGEWVQHFSNASCYPFDDLTAEVSIVHTASIEHIRISTNILWQVFQIFTEPAPYTLVSVNRNNEAWARGLHYSVDLRIQT